MRNITPRAGFDYFSGHAKNNHNHPAIYAYRGDIQKLVVVGRNYREEFPISRSEQAFNAYRRLLKQAKYKIGDAEEGRPPVMEPKKN
jgi:hypothetical protein